MNAQRREQRASQQHAKRRGVSKNGKTVHGTRQGKQPGQTQDPYGQESPSAMMMTRGFILPGRDGQGRGGPARLQARAQRPDNGQRHSQEASSQQYGQGERQFSHRRDAIEFGDRFPFEPDKPMSQPTAEHGSQTSSNSAGNDRFTQKQQGNVPPKHAYRPQDPDLPSILDNGKSYGVID